MSRCASLIVDPRSSGCTNSMKGLAVSSVMVKPSVRSQAGFSCLKYPSKPAMHSMSRERVKKRSRWLKPAAAAPGRPAGRGFMGIRFVRRMALMPVALPLRCPKSLPVGRGARARISPRAQASPIGRPSAIVEMWRRRAPAFCTWWPPRSATWRTSPCARSESSGRWRSSRPKTPAARGRCSRITRSRPGW